MGNQAREFKKLRRPEIQALRALAVALVVVFHLWPNALPGGYVGVDIFFVVSGFLITMHLVGEVDRTGTIKLSAFWARRMRRLLPAAFLVLGVSLLGALVWLPKAIWAQTFTEVAASALYVQNWALASSSVDYMAADNVPTIVQHFWSLSVEEQFYIVWPLLIVAVTLLAKRRTAIVWALSAVFVASLGFSVYATADSAASAYFLTPTRAWEFAAGGLLAFAPIAWKTTANVTGGPLRAAAGWLGLLLIGYSALVFSSATPFPGYAALLPVLGTVLIIGAGNVDRPWSFSGLTKHRPFQTLGDLSYSIYLWHWPLIILYPHIRGSEMRMNGAILVLGSAIALAFLTKKFVEDPFQQSKRLASRKPTYVLAAASMAVTLIVTTGGSAYITSLYEKAGDPQPAFATSADLAKKVDATLALDEWPLADQLPGKEAQAPEWVTDDCLNVGEREIRRCTYGNPTGTKTALVLGDSIATSYLPAIRGALDGEWKIIPLTMGECPAADVRVVQWGQTDEYTRCVDHRDWAVDFARDAGADMIIVANAGPSTYARLLSKNSGAQADLEWGNGLISTLAPLSTSTHRLVVVGSPVFANCVTKYGESPDSCEADIQVDQSRVLAEKTAVADVGGEYFDARQWMCTADLTVCPEQIGNALVRADNGHLTATYSSRLSNLMREVLLGRPEPRTVPE